MLLSLGVREALRLYKQSFFSTELFLESEEKISANAAFTLGGENPCGGGVFNNEPSSRLSFISWREILHPG